MQDQDMEAKIAKLPKWAQDLITARNRKIDGLHEIIDALNDPSTAAIIVEDTLNREAALGFTAHAVVRFKLTNGEKISFHHDGLAVKVYGDFGRLAIRPLAANNITLEVE